MAQARPAMIGLTPREILGIEEGEGVRLTLGGGKVWITQSMDRRDIVLDPGQSFVLDRPGLALIMAIEPSTLAIDVGDSCTVDDLTFRLINSSRDSDPLLQAA